MRVRLSEQVVDFVRRLAPEPRRRIRQALRELAEGNGDIKELEEPLHPYCRLRVGNYRILFQYATKSRIDCVFIEKRALVYEIFSQEFARQVRGKP